MPRSSRVLAALAALMGAAGVALAALATHADGGELARTAALFLILHAAALLGVSAHARPGDQAKTRIAAGFLLAAGAILFSGALSAHAFFGVRLPFAAPLGGVAMIAAWLALAVDFAAARTA